jgi:hypothetical protein
VKGETDLELDVTVTRHGPILAGGPGKGYGLAFRYTATAFPYRGFECFLPMMKATETQMDKSVEEEAVFLREIEEGRGPLYMDCSPCSGEDIAYIRWALTNEGNTAFLNYLDREGFDLRPKPPGMVRAEGGINPSQENGHSRQIFSDQLNRFYDPWIPVGHSCCEENC